MPGKWLQVTAVSAAQVKSAQANSAMSSTRFIFSLDADLVGVSTGQSKTLTADWTDFWLANRINVYSFAIRSTAIGLRAYYRLDGMSGLPPRQYPWGRSRTA